MQEQQAYVLFVKARERIDGLFPGEEFTVCDLFFGYEWKRIPRNLKASLGSLFYLASMQDDRIEALAEKSAKNQQRYRRI